MIKERLLSIARQYLPVTLRRRIVKYTRWPPVGWVMFGDLGRRKPISRVWGTERGLPIDRYYIEEFLEANSTLIAGHVLEIGDNNYTIRFGGSKVTRSDVLHVAERKDEVTIIGDLSAGENIPSDTFDCIILTQTLQLIFDLRPAVETVFRILKPGGVVLCTVPGISQISRYDMDRWGDYWRFTTRSARKIFEGQFPAEEIAVHSYGNVASSIAFLHGVAQEELKQANLDYQDPDYQLLVAIAARKPE